MIRNSEMANLESDRAGPSLVGGPVRSSQDCGVRIRKLLRQAPERAVKDTGQPYQELPLLPPTNNGQPWTRPIGFWPAESVRAGKRRTSPPMKAALLKPLQRLEEVRAGEPRPSNLQFGYLEVFKPHRAWVSRMG
jgi:hypothetical protein